MDKDNRLKILISTLSANSNKLIFEGPLNIDGIKNIKVSDVMKDELKKYIFNVFHEINERRVFTADKYKYSYIIDYETYESIITRPYNYTLTDLLEVYVILSDEYNNTDWTNFCCNNSTGKFNIFCNNCNDCKNCINCDNCDNCKKCIYCYNCNNCNDCKHSHYLSDCLRCDTCNNCNTCNKCTRINNKNNRYKINK